MFQQRREYEEEEDDVGFEPSLLHNDGSILSLRDH